jgi:hypothetical protein
LLMWADSKSEVDACTDASQHPDLDIATNAERPCQYEACHPQGCGSNMIVDDDYKRTSTSSTSGPPIDDDDDFVEKPHYLYYLYIGAAIVLGLVVVVAVYFCVVVPRMPPLFGRKFCRKARQRNRFPNAPENPGIFQDNLHPGDAVEGDDDGEDEMSLSWRRAYQDGPQAPPAHVPPSEMWDSAHGVPELSGSAEVRKSPGFDFF